MQCQLFDCLKQHDRLDLLKRHVRQDVFISELVAQDVQDASSRAGRVILGHLF